MTVSSEQSAVARSLSAPQPAAPVRELAGWGRVPVVRARELRSEDFAAASEHAALSRGLGRSYGDASLPAAQGDTVACSVRADRILAFDRAAGVLRAEAGLSLFALNRVLWRAGFAVPVVPGTQLVTLGGMAAADVHGKNQHRAGDFGDHVRALRVRVADGRVLEIGPEREPELFAGTLGGMGLLGHILEVELELERIASPWVYQETRAYPDLDALLAALREASRTWPYTVCWVDALRRGPGMGRGVLHCGRWAEPGEAPRALPEPRSGPRVPFALPAGLLGRPAIAAFNALHYALGKRGRAGIAHPQRFFAPLDALRDWNRLYGRRGPLQYQCVLPESAGSRAVERLFQTLAQRGGASFLSVVKDCGREGPGLLSFPRPGLSVALDLPLREGETQALVDALSEVVLGAGGRIYLAKDALTRPEHFRAMEGPRLQRFAALRRRWDPQRRLRSALSVRLLGEQP